MATKKEIDDLNFEILEWEKIKDANGVPTNKKTIDKLRNQIAQLMYEPKKRTLEKSPKTEKPWKKIFLII